MTRHYGDRMIAVALAIVALGLVAATFAVWVQAGQIKQQRAAMAQLLAERAEDRQDAAELRSLVQRLQDQVRSLGGVPATLPDSPDRRRGPSATTASPSTQATPAATRSPSPTGSTPRPSPTQHPPSRPPSPSPSPSCLVPILCREVAHGSRPPTG